jgi:hypothetical protein
MVGYPLFDPGHFMHGHLFDQAAYGVDKAFETIRVHVTFKASKTLPRFVEDEYSRIFVVLVQIVSDTPVLFSRLLYEIQQLVLDSLYGFLLSYQLRYYG